MEAAHTQTTTNGSGSINASDGVRNPHVEANALTNAVKGVSTANYRTIVDGFCAMGIPAGEIVPRVNVFTFHAWRGLGRCVRKGQHGVKVTTFIPRRTVNASTGAIGSNKFPTTTTVFHLSQTDPLPASGAAEAAA